MRRPPTPCWTPCRPTSSTSRRRSRSSTRTTGPSTRTPSKRGASTRAGAKSSAPCSSITTERTHEHQISRVTPDGRAGSGRGAGRVRIVGLAGLGGIERRRHSVSAGRGGGIRRAREVPDGADAEHHHDAAERAAAEGQERGDAGHRRPQQRDHPERRQGTRGDGRLELLLVTYDPANPGTFGAAVDTALSKHADY